MTTHAAVWIDHQEARIFHVQADGFDEATLHSPHRHIHRHPKGGTAEHNHPDDLRALFRDTARALDGFDEILVLGPSTAKVQFLSYVHDHDRAIEPKIVGSETVDHPTDRQLVAHVKQYFGMPAPRLR
ncbi:MAG: translational machinery protein [Polyangiaceae bacterium]|jgi:stalled ribosome rescue protein Dom34